MGLLSDAGCPGVADPGAVMVKRAHKMGYTVKPLVGPFPAFGLDGFWYERTIFAFNGYLPIDKKERLRTIKQLEKRSGDLDQTQLFIETPYRNEQFLNDLLRTLSPATMLSVACDLTLPTEWVFTAAVKDWKNTEVQLQKRPAIFLFYKELAI